jgi:hypothetical protein
MNLDLAALEEGARRCGLLLRLRAPRRWRFRGLHVGVARPTPQGPLLLLGELKGWTLDGPGAALRLDTMRVRPDAPAGVGPLIWAATFAWALEATSCRTARLLAIRDEERQHRRLVRYFRGLGFQPERPLGGGPADLPLRLIWGGAGLLMRGDCREGFRRCQRRLRADPRWSAASD